eukprot:3841758-Alexandrium_andersonii.AAC.1
MSASLVGSGDVYKRQGQTALRGSESAKVGDPPASLPSASGAVLGAAPPVSYTHLTLPTICSV